jgi:cryptochrome
VNRIGFLLESLRDLHNNLEARGSRLLVLRGKPQEVLPRVLKDWAITSLCFEHDTEPYAKERDAQIKALAEGLGVQVHEPISHTLYVSDTTHGRRRHCSWRLYHPILDCHKVLLHIHLQDPAAIVARNGGRPPLTMKAFEKLTNLLGDPLPPAADSPATIPGPAAEVRFPCVATEQFSSRLLDVKPAT